MSIPSQLSFDGPSLKFISNFRPISSLFLGAVFITGVNYSSSWLQGLLWRYGGQITRARQSNIEDGLSEKQSTPDTPTTVFASPSDNLTLAFALSLCFVFASIARFTSLLSFQPDGAAACAFVIAWGGMAAQTARLIGLVMLFSDLRYLGITKWESIVLIVWTIAGIVFVFVNNAIGTGTISPLVMTGFAVCERKYVLPLSLVSSSIYLVLELYVSGRLLSFFSPKLSPRHHQLGALQDLRVLRALSLLLLEVLTIVPLATAPNELGEIIPFCVGSILVLMAFNRRYPVQADTPINSIPQSGSSHQQSGAGSAVPSAGWRRSLLLSLPTASRHPPTQAMPVPHPFSAVSLRYPTLQSDEWTDHPHLHTARSDKVLETGSVRSVKHGFIQIAEHTTPPGHSGLVITPPRSVVQTDPRISDPSQNPQQSARPFPGRIVPSQTALGEYLTPRPLPSHSSLPTPRRPTIITDVQPQPAAPHPQILTAVLSPRSALFGSDIIRPSGGMQSQFSAPPSRTVSFQASDVSWNVESVESTTGRISRQLSAISISPRWSLNTERAGRSGISRWPTFNETNFPPNAFISTNPSRRSSLSSLSIVIRGQFQNLPPLPRQSVVVRAPRGPRPPTVIHAP